MGKKSHNPADAFRKAQRKKELKKHKAERSKARELALVKRDTSELEDEIEQLELSGTEVRGTPEEKARLKELKAELGHILKKKEEYVREHPEQRRLVYRPRKEKGEEEGFKLQEEIIVPKEFRKNYFKANGLPKHPERSIYYDPVFNPLGVAPPGMRYEERALLPGEVDSDVDEGDEDDDIVMPDGPPPSAANEETVGSDDEIMLPGDPSFVPPLPPMPPPTGELGLLPPGIPPYPPPLGFMPPLPHNQPGMMPPPPPGFYPRNAPPPSIPHKTLQPHPSLPPKPPRPMAENAVISAEPELRDLKKESTAFVPASIRKTKASGSKVNAAPTVDSEEVTGVGKKPDLLDTLKAQFLPPKTAKSDDYQNFVNEMGL